MRPLRAIVALTLLLPTTVLLGAPPAAAISDACVFDVATGTVYGIGGVVGFTYRITRQAGTSFIVFTDSGGTDYCYDDPTTKATVRNTDRIEFSGTNSNEEFVIDLSGGSFAPGDTAEGAGASEIEIEVTMYDGSDNLYVIGSGGGDTVAFSGIAAARLNRDADKDVTLSGVDRRWVYGNGGDDAVSIDYPVSLVVYGGDGDDVLTGDDGWDSLFGEKGNDVIGGNGGDDTLYGYEGADRLVGGDQNDYLVPGPGNDSANGGADDDSFESEPNADGADVFIGGPGDEDSVSYSQRSTRVVLDLDGAADDGEAGEGDRIGKDVESLSGGDGNDKLTGSPGRNYLYGNDGTDLMSGGDGDDQLYGGVGDDTVSGGAGDDGLYGNEGNDALDAGPGNDNLSGNIGNDTHTGGVGNDTMYADSAADGPDVFTGGDGRDGVSYQSRTGALVVDVDNVADDGFLGEGDNVRADVEFVTGGSNADTLTGSSGANQLYGGSGNDTLNGLGGEDTLYGTDGLDIINGGEGYDYVAAGNDNDTVNIANGDDDYADCGPGTDTVNEDVAYDTVQNCEL